MTEEDRILHDAAARAAGYDIWWKDSICKGGRVLAAFIGERPWRPLDDSGDSFRLMLDARITPFVYDHMLVVRAYPLPTRTVPATSQDREAVARRIILEVAAKLENKQ